MTLNQAEMSVTVNGRSITAAAAVRMHAADFLRHRLGLTGTHVGCEQGACGMCTILVDGKPVKGCLMLAVQLDGTAVETVESLAPDDCPLQAIQLAFREEHALQCGFCTPGFLMVAQALARRGRALTREEIRAEISGVICRCTGYHGIVEAIHRILAEAGADPAEARP
jgi:aerobic-type carbon monoxide dehydrogenase small subunit (CoxS/CutS family)